MNLVDDAERKVDAQRKQMEGIWKKEIELAKEQEKLQHAMEDALDM